MCTYNNDKKCGILRVALLILNSNAWLLKGKKLFKTLPLKVPIINTEVILYIQFLAVKIGTSCYLNRFSFMLWLKNNILMLNMYYCCLSQMYFTIIHFLNVAKPCLQLISENKSLLSVWLLSLLSAAFQKLAV